MSDQGERSRDPLDDRMHSADRIGALLRASGRRPAIPPERAARVEEAARATWQETLTRRARGRSLRRWSLLAAAAVIMTGAGLMLRDRSAPTAVPAPIGRVELLVGEAWSRPVAPEATAAAVRLRAGDAIAAGMEISTPANGRVALRLASGQSLRLDEGSRLQALSARTFGLERGAVYFDSGGVARTAAAVEIRTRLGDIRDLGTQFEARMLDASLRVRVREGVVSVGARGIPLQASAGEELTLAAEGLAARGEVDPFGLAWTWTETVAGFGDLQGRSLREFLDWYARERGLRLELDGDDLTAAATRITLGGSIEGMTLDQAIAAVLATTDLRHAESEGTLRVSRNDLGAHP